MRRILHCPIWLLLFSGCLLGLRPAHEAWNIEIKNLTDNLGEENLPFSEDHFELPNADVGLSASTVRSAASPAMHQNKSTEVTPAEVILFELRVSALSDKSFQVDWENLSVFTWDSTRNAKAEEVNLHHADMNYSGVLIQGRARSSLCKFSLDQKSCLYLKVPLNDADSKRYLLEIVACPPN